MASLKSEEKYEVINSRSFLLQKISHTKVTFYTQKAEATPEILQAKNMITRAILIE